MVNTKIKIKSISNSSTENHGIAAGNQAAALSKFEKSGLQCYFTKLIGSSSVLSQHYKIASTKCAGSKGTRSSIPSETSGGSLALNPTIYHPSGNYYGLCQWDLRYYPKYKDISFELQLDYLLESITVEFKTFGRLYKKDFIYEDFLTITDPAEAAYAFAKVYERCNPISFDLRKQAAVKAYEYFSLTN